MRKETHRQFDWSGNVEQLEEKIAMSADPLGGLLGGAIEHHAIVDNMPPLNHHNLNEQPPALEHHLDTNLPPAIEHHRESQADFWLDSDNLRAIDSDLERIEQSLANAHDQSGMTAVRTDYGFDGTGQTVAVIDSGIAYDHFALGGGFGSNYRVVGGWDFTGENDANPYDDGPSGSHGTHVAGIVGASGGSHEGVAPGVDLVGLRVFDDAGNGYFSWVENALQWVYDNRDTFENPITAVNLSLGVASWNSDSIPSWANLENEFYALKQAGIFVAVSAGNSFTSFNEAGLSYPAASPHVVPVASVDDSGSLSYYSQRNSRVIAAPGRGIYSTVPDYKGNNNGVTDDYASFSGTSMASPYVAGASVIIREAMEFAGYTNITQDTIYNHMVSTADSFYDSATDAYYNRLNMEAAIDALMPADDFGSTVGSAFNLGSLSDQSRNGSITTLDDVDYFKFTASSTGSVSFTASSMTHNLTADWELSGGSGVWSGNNNETFTIDVVEGQEYTVGFSSDDGLGHYVLDIASTGEAFTFTDWGAISFSEIDGLANSGDNWYRIVTSNPGLFSAEAFFDANGGQASLELYDSSLESIDTGTSADGTSRVNAWTTAGTELYLKVSGDNNDIDFRVTNLVNVTGTTVTIAGTDGDDAFTFDAGSTHELSVNGTTYSFSNIAVTSFEFDGGEGYDSINMYGTSGDETAIISFRDVSLAGSSFDVQASNIENVSLNGGGGNDVATLNDTAGDDRFVGTENYSYMTGDGFYSFVRDFNHVYAVATAGGHDEARLYDSKGDELFYGYSDFAYMQGDGFHNQANTFERVYAYGTGSGYDVAYLYDSVGDDDFYGRSNYAYLRGDSSYNYASTFDRVYAISTLGGYDEAYLYDSANDDTFYGRENYSYLFGTGFYNYASNFDRVYAISTAGGYDQAYLYDSAGDDTFYGKQYFSYLFGDGFYNYASKFDRVFAIADNGGNDTAYLYDSSGDDTFYGRERYSYLFGSGFYNYASKFDRVYALGYGGGNDTAYLYGTDGNDDFYGRENYSYLRGNGYYNYTSRFDHVFADAGTGATDRAFLYNVADDLLPAGATDSTGSVNNFTSVTTYNDSGTTVDADVATYDFVFTEAGS